MTLKQTKRRIEKLESRVPVPVDRDDHSARDELIRRMQAISENLKSAGVEPDPDVTLAQVEQLTQACLQRARELKAVRPKRFGRV